MKKNKIISILLVFCFIIGMLPVVSFAESNIVADVSTLNGISKTGLPASGVFKKLGDYTLKWAGADLYNPITIPTVKSDWSDSGYLEFWVYSKNNTKTEFSVGLISDNPQTACLDYYITDVSIGWSGWNLVSLCYSGDNNVFTQVNTPVGINSISEIRFWPTYGGKSPVNNTELYIDSFVISDQSHSGVDVGTDKDDSIYVLADYSVETNVVNAGFPASSEKTLSGPVSLKWAGSDMSRVPPVESYPTDWTQYKALAINVYSEVANNSIIRFVAVSENPTTDGSDYYMANMTLNWTGWKTVVFALNETDFVRSRNPLGWTNITGFDIWTGFGGVNADPSTSLYLDKIFLTKDSLIDNSVDYILDATTEENFFDAASAIKENTANDAHPRLLITEDDIENIKSLVKTNNFMAKTYKSVINTANAALEAQVQKYEFPDGLRLSRAAPNMMPPLALAYLLTDDVRYKDRLWQELEAVCNFSDWNPGHFLDVGDFAYGVALAYDWLYDDWTEAERRIIRNGIVRNGFGPSMTHLRSGYGFAGQTNNWNQVISSGIGLAALALADEPGYEELANEVINRTGKCLPKAVATFAPDGACPEGPSYWSYAKEGFYTYVSCMLDTMKYDFGLSQMEGMENTGYFPISIMGPTNQVFNFGDGGAGSINGGIFFNLARIYDKPELGGYELNIVAAGDWSDLVMYREDERMSDYRKYMPLDKHFRGNQDLATMRSSWNDHDALFVAFKGGNNAAGHNDLDLGTFVLDALGARWIQELGSEYYEAPGMWDEGRWLYYRKNTEGQNTLVINPSTEPGQDPKAVAPIETFETSDSAAYGIIDLTDAYADVAKNVKRGFGLVNNRSIIVLQDEIKTSSPSEIYSFFHTGADIEISADKKSATLSINDERLRVDLISAEGELLEMDAVPLPTSAKPPYPNMENKDIKKLAVHLTNAVNPTITVTFTPLQANQPDPKPMSTIIPLANWDNYKNMGVSISSLSVDGVQLDEFTPYNTFYNIGTGIYGVVSAQAGEGTELEITQASGVGESAFVTATDKSSGMQSVYSVSFVPSSPAIFTEGLSAYEIVGVKASSIPEPVNAPINTIDGDISTKWAAEGDGEWIEWDLGEPKWINSVALAFMSGDARFAELQIQISEDGKNYVTVFDGLSSGKTTALESFDFADTYGRYVRFVSFGNSVNEWVSLTEVNIPQVIKEFDDIANHWAREDIMLFAGLGFVNGVSPSEFKPNNTVTRAEFMAIVSRSIGLDSETPYGNEFADVASSDWYASILSACKSYGIIPDDMVADGNFNPGSNITREEMAAVVVKAYETSLGTNHGKANIAALYSDSGEVSPCYSDAVASGVALRMIKGTSDTTFSPKANATRAEAVVMIKRLLTLIY